MDLPATPSTPPVPISGLTEKSGAASPTPLETPELAPGPPTDKRSNPLRLIWLVSVLTSIAIVSLVSVMSRVAPGVLDLLANFRLQWAGLVLVGFVACAVTRSKWATVVCGVALIAHLFPLLALVVPADQPQGAGPTISVVQFNVLTSNTEVDEASAWLRETNAEVIVAQETNARWVEGLTAGLDGWSWIPTNTVRSDNFGMAIFVRNDLAVDETVAEVFTPDHPAIALSLPVGDSSLLIYGIHTLPPTSSRNVNVADEQLAVAAAQVNQHLADGQPAVVVGDLNATRWSKAYRTFTGQAELANASDGSGLTGTWHSSLWFTGMITIDHVLVSETVRVDQHEVGPDLGSDHRPVRVEITLTS